MHIKLLKATLLSFLYSTISFADIHDRIEYKLGRVLTDVETIINGNVANCTPITQEEINQGGGIFVCDHSGSFCLTQDIIGTIVLAHENACLNLDCHQLDAGGADRAITVLGNNCSVSNGSIVNVRGSTSRVISVESEDGFQINNVHFSDFQSFGLYGDGIADFVIKNCTFTNGGEAIFFGNSQSGSLVGNKIHDITNRESVNEAIVQLENCECVMISDLQMCDNFKNYIFAQPISTISAFLLINNSDHIALDNVIIHSTQNDVLHPGGGDALVSAAFIGCSSIFISNSMFKTKNFAGGHQAVGLALYQTRDVSVQNIACLDTLNTASPSFWAFGFVLADCQNAIIENSIFNRTSASVGSEAIGAFAVIGASSIHFHNCEFSENNIGTSGGVGLAILLADNCSVIDCEAFNNSSVSFFINQGGRATISSCCGNATVSIDSAQDCVLENVIINHAEFGSAFEISNTQGIVLKDCIATGCTSGNGFLVFNSNENLKLENCEAVMCAASGFSVANGTVQASLVQSCKAIGNSLFGFAIPANALANTIANCTALNNASGNYSVDVPAPLIFTVDDAGAIIGVSDYFHNLSRI